VISSNGRGIALPRGHSEGADMQRINRIWVGVLFVTCAATGYALADDPQPQQDPQQAQGSPPPPPTAAMAEKMSLSATVEKVDAKKRTLMLKNEQGNTVKVNVPESVSRLDAIKKGDKITLDYYEAVALSLKKPEPGKKPSATETAMAERTPGTLPGGLVAKNVTATVEVVKVDKDNHQVTIKGPGGETDTVKIDESMAPDLEKIKKGDRIKASYTEAVAISVTPEKKAG
jgi:hypothetical protein